MQASHIDWIILFTLLQDRNEQVYIPHFNVYCHHMGADVNGL
jgi:hypothetical protein